MVRVYKKAYFNVYSDYNGEYIIHNTKKEFQNGHTHIREFGTAKYLVDLALHRSLPNRRLKYFIESLIRISNDADYIDKLNHLKPIKRRKYA